ncbi:MBL fold metallo-hydrolase [Microbacterium kribbense]|uniref:MBL fold metallo-hydrolase n=1 Tax=Microbacterium kribbense TaxID=433645 RepID=A0ABP7GXB2_9MICO
MRLVLLGTGGGPRPSGTRFPSSQALVIGDRVIVVDCGNGVAKQLSSAGISPRNLSDLLLTHHHVDHSADLGYLPLISWVEGRSETIGIYGPPPTVGALESILDGYEEDLRKRTASTGRPPFRPMLDPHDIVVPGLVFEDDDVRVTAAFVDHPPFEIALGYRIDSASGSVVVSGDTAPSPNLVDLARGADVLIHEVVHPSAITKLQNGTNASTIADHIRRNHTMLADVGAIAEQAGVRTLVLSHLVPHDVDDGDWLAGLGGFSGRTVVGRDLLEVDIR